MSRSSDYSGADVDAAVALLRSQGTDPETVSLPCALAVYGAYQLEHPEPGSDRAALERLAALHDDCDGTRDAPRRQGTGAAPCLCPSDAPHRAHHVHASARSVTT